VSRSERSEATETNTAPMHLHTKETTKPFNQLHPQPQSAPPFLGALGGGGEKRKERVVGLIKRAWRAGHERKRGARTLGCGLGGVCKVMGKGVCKVAGIRVCKVAGIRVCKVAGIRVCKVAGIRVCKVAGKGQGLTAGDGGSRAVAAAPSHGDALTNYGALLEEVRLDLDGARSCYERAVVSNGHDVVALCHLSGLLSRQVHLTPLPPLNPLPPFTPSSPAPPVHQMPEPLEGGRRKESEGQGPRVVRWLLWSRGGPSQSAGSPWVGACPKGTRGSCLGFVLWVRACPKGPHLCPRFRVSWVRACPKGPWVRVSHLCPRFRVSHETVPRYMQSMCSMCWR
jgi:hypothetical protein